MISFGEYQSISSRTLSLLSEKEGLVMAAMGLCGESGEASEIIKKYVFHDHDLDRDKLRNELGDILWYLAAMATVLDVSLEDIASENIAKLKARYPDVWDPERSRNRDTIALAISRFEEQK